MWMRTPILATALLALSACDDAPSTHPTDALAAPEDTAPRVDATTPPRDATPPRDMALAVYAVLPADATTAPDAAPAPPTRAPLPPPPDATQLAAPPGYTFARGLIHMHSVHSHDACDGDPKPGGLPNAPCLADLRAAVCRSRLDYMLLTDHPESFADVSFEEAVLHDAAAGDTLVRDAEGAIVGGELACADGRRVLIAPGSEGDLMPVMLRRTPNDRALYRTRAPEAVAALREAGAIVLHAHTEERTFEELWPLGLDGFEIYNLHANVNPRWRQLPEVLPDILEVIQAGVDGPHPDLAMLAALRENPWAIDTWNRFIARRRTLGVAGSDIHQNLPSALFRPTDGERLDSYRRLTTWFANYLLVSEMSLDGVREALMTGRAYTVFHLLGEPDGLDFALTDAAGARHDMGSELAFADGQRIVFTPPRLPDGSTIEARLLRVTAVEPGIEGGPDTEVAVVAQSGGTIEFTVDVPGAYRVEVRQTPEHLRAALGSLADLLVRPTVWIYTNPIYVR